MRGLALVGAAGVLLLACSLEELSNGQRPSDGGAGGIGGGGTMSAGGSGSGGDGGHGGIWAGGRCRRGPEGSDVTWICGFGNDQDQGETDAGEEITAVRVASAAGRLAVAASSRGALDVGGDFGPQPPALDPALENVIVAALTPEGDPGWSRVLEGSAAQKRIAEVSVSPDGRVAVVGSFAGGGLEAGGQELIADGTDGFLYVFEADGSLVGARFFRHRASALLPASDQRAHAVAFDALGSIYVGGELTDTLAMTTADGAESAGCWAEMPLGYLFPQAYVLKLAPDLSCSWIEVMSGDLFETGAVRTVAAIPGGGVAAGGSFRGGMRVGDVVLSSNGINEEAFVAELDADGGAIGALSFGGGNDDRVSHLAADGASIYLTGFHRGSSVVPGCPEALAAAGRREALVARLDRTGGDPICAWAHSFPSFQTDEGRGIALAAGHVAFAGYFSESFTVEGSQVITQGFEDVLIGWISPAGAITSVRAMGSAGTDAARAAAPVVGADEIYVAGIHGGAIEGLLRTPDVPADFFVARVRSTP